MYILFALFLRFLGIFKAFSAGFCGYIMVGFSAGFLRFLMASATLDLMAFRDFEREPPEDLKTCGDTDLDDISEALKEFSKVLLLGN